MNKSIISIALGLSEALFDRFDRRKGFLDLCGGFCFQHSEKKRTFAAVLDKAARQ